MARSAQHFSGGCIHAIEGCLDQCRCLKTGKGNEREGEKEEREREVVESSFSCKKGVVVPVPLGVSRAK